MTPNDPLFPLQWYLKNTGQFGGTPGIDINVVFIGTDDEIWAKIKGSEGKDFDVMAVNTAQLQRYIDANLVTPWDLNAIPNQKEVLPRFRELNKIRGETRDGKVYQGVVIYDAVDSLILQTGATTTVRLAGPEISARRIVPRSLMPAGLLDSLTDAEIVDLHAYLNQ